MSQGSFASLQIHRAGFEEEEHHKKVELEEALQSHLWQKEPTGVSSTSGHGYIGGEHDRGDSEKDIREVEPWSELDDLLFRAIEERDAASVQLLVECRVDPEKHSNEENSHISAVHLTVEIGWVDGIRYLCKVKADVNLAPEKCSSPQPGTSRFYRFYCWDWDCFGLGTTTALRRPRSPAWHRRQRRARHKARKAARKGRSSAAQLFLLATHHGSMAPKQGGAGSQSSQKGGPGKGKEKADNPQVTKIEFGLPPSMVQSLQSIATRATQDLWSQTAFTAENATVEQLAQRSANALGRLSRRLNGNVRAKKDLQDALLAWLSTMGQHLLGLAHRVDALSRKVDEDTVAAVEEMRQVMAAQPSVTTEEQLDRAIQSLGPVWSEGQVVEVQRLAAALRAFSTTLAMPSGTQVPVPGLAGVHRGGPFLGMQAAAGPSSDVPMFSGPQQPAGDLAADHSSEMSFGPLGNTSSQAPSGMDGQRSGRWRKRSGGNVDRPSKSPRRDLEGAPWPGEATGRTPEGLKRDAQTAVADDDPELLPATATASAWVVSWLALLRFAVDSGADLVGEVSSCPQQDKAMQLTLDAQAQDVVLRTAESVWTALENAVADPAHADLQSLFLSLQGFLHSVRGCANALPQVRQGLLVAALLSNGNLRDPFAYAPSTAQEWLFPDLLLEAGVPLRGFVAKEASMDAHVQVLLRMPSPMRPVGPDTCQNELE
ncbi:unnamed protein product [Symbiodinium sp. CCMP2592]|nr:unnamed protein product [Symbiodinium sp. CCMP2592]